MRGCRPATATDDVHVSADFCKRFGHLLGRDAIHDAVIFKRGLATIRLDEQRDGYSRSQTSGEVNERGGTGKRAAIGTDYVGSGGNSRTGEILRRYAHHRAGAVFCRIEGRRDHNAWRLERARNSH